MQRSQHSNNNPTDGGEGQSASPFYLSLPWEGLLRTLEIQGFQVGVNQHLRLEALLHRLPPTTPPERFKYLLAPLFVKDEMEQAKFYALCDAFLESYDERIKASEPITLGPVRRKPWGVVVALVISLLLVLVVSPFVYRTWIATPPTRPRGEGTIPTSGGQTGQKGTKPTPDPSFPKPTESRTSAPRQITFPIRIEPPGSSTLWEVWGGKLLLPLLLVPLAALALLAWMRHRRNVPKKGTPPFQWPLQVADPNYSVHDVPLLLDTVRRMRTRQTTDVDILDIDRTISRTLEEGGFPVLVNRPATRPPEYLALIDRRSVRDHLAAFYADLVRVFQREGIHAEFYFFDEDIRLCRKSGSDEGQTLSALTTKYADTHRLLIIAEGHRLLDPITGRMPAWTSLFWRWRECALFLPESLPEWSVYELEMQGRFWLFPADLQGLRTFLERLSGERRDTATVLDVLLQTDPPLLPSEFCVERRNELYGYLGETGFRWLCLCALYPELRWNLTLALGALSALPSETRSQENALRLARLEWFREGVIPEGWRWGLMRELEKSPEIEREARETIARLMAMNMPPEGSYAAQGFGLELAVQRWAADPTAQSRDALGKLLRTMPPEDIVRRTVLRKLLQTRRPGEGWRWLSRRVESVCYPHGIRELGLRTSVPIICALLFVALGLLALLRIPVRIPTSVAFARLEYDQAGLDLGECAIDGRLEAVLNLQNRTGSAVTLGKPVLDQRQSVFKMAGEVNGPLLVPPHTERHFVVQFQPRTSDRFTATVRLHLEQTAKDGRTTAASPESLLQLRASASNRVPPLDLLQQYGIDLVLIPEGEFQMGDSDMSDNPRHKVYLNAYWISKNLVTGKQYLAFCAATGHKRPEAPSFDPNWSQTDHPIVNVSWDDAQAYCVWLSSLVGRKITLPTEAQWEKAARGTDGRKFPWGNDFQAAKLWSSVDGSKSGTHKVGELGVSPYGVTDMAGNVWQWCQDTYDKNFWKSSAGQVKDTVNNTSNSARVLRGGSWADYDVGYFRCAFRDWFAPDLRDNNWGFRCAVPADSH